MGSRSISYQGGEYPPFFMEYVFEASSANRLSVPLDLRHLEDLRLGMRTLRGKDWSGGVSGILVKVFHRGGIWGWDFAGWLIEKS